MYKKDTSNSHSFKYTELLQSCPVDSKYTHLPAYRRTKMIHIYIYIYTRVYYTQAICRRVLLFYKEISSQYTQSIHRGRSRICCQRRGSFMIWQAKPRNETGHHFLQGGGGGGQGYNYKPMKFNNYNNYNNVWSICQVGGGGGVAHAPFPCICQLYLWLRIRRVPVPYTLYSDSALVDINNSVNALLVLNWRYVVRHHESHIMSEKKYLSFWQIWILQILSFKSIYNLPYFIVRKIPTPPKKKIDRKLESCMAQFSFPSIFLAFWAFMISDIYAANLITDHRYALQKSDSFWLSPYDENAYHKSAVFKSCMAYWACYLVSIWHWKSF